MIISDTNKMIRSYQLCLTPGERVCTRIFSLEMKIPYIETEEEDDDEKVIEDTTEKGSRVRYFSGHNSLCFM